MRNRLTTYGIASTVVLSLLLGMPASGKQKNKSAGRVSKIQRAGHNSKSHKTPSRPIYDWMPEKDKIIRPFGISKVVKESNRQGLRLLTKLVTSEGKDVVISPAGSTAGYLLLLNGMRGAGRNELAQIMGVEQTTDQSLANTTSAFLRSISSTTPKSELGLAAATNPPLAFRPEFTKLVHSQFGGLVLDTAQNDMDKLREFLKAKTAQRFGGHIEPPQTMKIKLYSTAYFNGIWQNKFSTDDTNSEPFHRVDGSTVRVPTMHRFFQGLKLHLRGKNFQALRLPYEPANDTTFDAMYIFLPDKGTSVNQLLEELTNTGLDAYAADWKGKEGNLSIPRFQMASDNLNIGLFSAQGKEVRVPNFNVDAMCVQSIPPADVKVEQSTSIDFNENGTEAASLTEFTISLGFHPGEKFDMKVDRPFVFILGNSRTGNFLFAGAVFDPKDSKLPFADVERSWKERIDAIDKKENLYSYISTMQKFAEFYRKDGKLDQAVEVLSKISDAEPRTETQINIFDQLAQIFVEQKKYDEAEKLYKQMFPIQKRLAKERGDYALEYYGRFIDELNNYADLLLLMKSDPSQVYDEIEALYKAQVTLELGKIGECPASDAASRSHYADKIVRAKIDLAEFYARINNKDKAIKTYESAIRSEFASTEPDYFRLVKIGKVYLKLLREEKLNWEANKIESNLKTWTDKAKPQIKKTKSEK